ncbi:MAG TPA: lysylphosphatidylglycerol synthase domain-containing protein [Patescibacteria group bacterium]|nr:lysylphosphatidylglycerol synthase domain-containing protein [Patescibacteria group bacterium]
MSKRSLLLAVQIVFYGALIWFVVQKFDKLTASVDLGILLNKPLHIVLSILCFLAFYGLLSLHWMQISDKYEKFPQSHQWLAFFASQPYKYLPSSVFTFSSRAVYAKKLGLPMKQSSAVQLIENFNILSAGFCIALLFLIYHASAFLGTFAGLLFLLGLFAVCFVPVFKLPKTAIKISGRDWAKLFILPLAGWLIAGLAFYLIVLATGQQIEFASAVATNAMAVALGILAIFAPGGIGVRELVYNKFSVGNAGIILWRLLTLVIDIAVGLVAIYAINRSLRTKNHKV